MLAGLYFSTKTFNLQQQGQITDRFTKAIDQLGTVKAGANGKPIPNLEARLGGIYALERIAKDSPRDHWTIMEVLTAYVRQNAPVKNKSLATKQRSNSMPVASINSQAIPVDIQAVLSVIGRRDISHDLTGHRIDLSATDLSGADFIDANLQNASLYGANLKKANLTRANLNNVDLNTAHLEGARFTDAQLDGAQLFGTHITGAILYHTDLRKAFGLAQDQLIGTRGDTDTLLPKNLKRPDSWSNNPIKEINKASKIVDVVLKITDAVSKIISTLP